MCDAECCGNVLLIGRLMFLEKLQQLLRDI